MRAKCKGRCSQGAFRSAPGGLQEIKTLQEASREPFWKHMAAISEPFWTYVGDAPRGINCNLCPQYPAWQPIPGSSESTLGNLLFRGTILCTRHGKHELTPESINQMLSFKLYSSTSTSGMLSARWPVSGAHAPCEIIPDHFITVPYSSYISL